MHRLPYLRRGRTCAKFTIPTLLPPDGWTGTTDLPEPWNNMGARGVNNLASKLLLSLLPPGASFFRMELDPKALEGLMAIVRGDQQQFAAIQGEIETATAEIEKRVVTWVETRKVRTALFAALKHLIVSGNVLLNIAGSDSVRVFRLDKYVCLRDPSGKVLELVVKESVSRAALPAAILSLLDSPGADNKKPVDKVLDLYTHIRWVRGQYHVHQEIQGKVIPGSRGRFPEERTPWIALRWSEIDGEDYGLGHVDSYVGDLSTLDMLTQAVTEGSALAARIIYLKRPNSVGKVDDLKTAPNGGVVVMEHDAIQALGLEKFNDFRTAHERILELEKTLSFAFLLNSAIQRSGERVTAEEIRYMARELEDALGGTYSVLSQELQLPLVRRILHVMEREKAIRPLPAAVQPMIITGLEGLGRGQDLARLDAFIGGLPNEQAGAVVNWDEYMRRRAVALSVDTKGLIKTPEQIAQEQQAAQMAAMVAQLGPNAVNQLGNVASSSIQANAKQQETTQANG